VLHYGTHNAPRLGLFAVKTMLKEMSKDDNAGFKKLAAIGEQVTVRLNQVAKDIGKHKMIVQNVGSMFHPLFTELDEITDCRQFCSSVDVQKYGEFAELMRNQGVFVTGNKILHNLSCTEHTQADIDNTIEAAGRALDQM